MNFTLDRRLCLSGLCVVALSMGAGCSDDDTLPNNYGELSASLWELGNDVIQFSDRGLTVYTESSTLNCYIDNGSQELQILGGPDYANTDSTLFDEATLTISSARDVSFFNISIFASEATVEDNDLPIVMDVWERYVISGDTLTRSRLGFSFNGNTYSVREPGGEDETVDAILEPFTAAATVFARSTITAADIDICP